MAKVTGPLFSMSASGTIGNAVTYGAWKGIEWARVWFIPSNPRTPEQQNVRKALTLLVGEWSTLGDVAKTVWNAFAAGTKMSGFNQYVKRGMLAYISQLTSAVTPLSVTVAADPPVDVWTWLPVV